MVIYLFATGISEGSPVVAFSGLIVFPIAIWLTRYFRQQLEIVLNYVIQSILYMGYFSFVIIMAGTDQNPILLAAIGIVVASSYLMTALIMGVSLARSFIYLDIAIDPVPPGDHTVYQSGLDGEFKKSTKSWLNHILAYFNPDVVAAIARYAGRQ